MSSWKIRMAAVGLPDAATIELIDNFGPVNTWRCTDPKLFTPDRGDFTNQSNRVVPTLQPLWVLNDLDIDSVSVGSTGRGVVVDSRGTFPPGDVEWTVLEKL